MNILIHPDLKRSVRIRGAELGITMSEAVRQAITAWLASTEPQEVVA